MDEHFAQRLTDGVEMAPYTMSYMDANGRRYVSLPDLELWLSKMGEAAVNEVKQDLYKAIRDYLHDWMYEEEDCNEPD